MDVIPNALPARAITVTPPKSSGGWWLVAAGLMFLGLTAGMLWISGFELINDLNAKADLQPARGVRFEEARCKTKAFLLTNCTVKIVDTQQAGDGKKTFDYMMLNWGDRGSITALRSASNPAYVTTSIGQDQLINRVITFGLLEVFLLALGLGSMWQVWRGMRTQSQFKAMSGQPIDAGLVRVTGVTSNKKTQGWTYTWADGGKTKKHTMTFPAASPPLVTDEGAGIAVRGATGQVPMLLDGAAASLSLTEPEKAHFFKTVAARVGASDPTRPPAASQS
jgi:hypothetical protein